MVPAGFAGVVGILCVGVFSGTEISSAGMSSGRLGGGIERGFFFTYATWGLPSVALGASGAFLAMAAVIHGLRETGWRMVAWVVLGGLGLGQGVMESFDVGGIFSLYVAVFVLMAAYNRNETERGAWGLATAKGVGLVVVLAVASALMAGHALSNLLKTEGKAAAAQQQRMTDQQQWDFATQWSLPKAETARLAVPGLFGYRLDSAEGARYWGAVGQSPGWQPGQPGLPRHSGYGIYAGMLVLLVGLWALVQAALGSAGRLGTVDRRWVIFWGGLVVLSVLFAWGGMRRFIKCCTRYRSSTAFATRSSLCIRPVWGWWCCLLTVWKEWRGRIWRKNAKPISSVT